MGLSVCCMTTKQRRHFVLAKNYEAASPVLEEYRKNGLKDTWFLSSHTELIEKKAEDLAFILVPGWEENRASADNWEAVSRKIKTGAIVKAYPKKPTPGLDLYTSLFKDQAGAVPFPTPVLRDFVDVMEKPEKQYNHVFIGGPYNGWTMSPTGSAGGQIVIRNAAITVTYLMYEFRILGVPLTFWVTESLWDDRQRMVREYLLKNVAAS